MKQMLLLAAAIALTLSAGCTLHKILPPTRIPPSLEESCKNTTSSPRNILENGFEWWFLDCDKDDRPDIVSRSSGDHGQPWSTFYIVTDPEEALKMNKQYVTEYVLPLPEEIVTCDNGSKDEPHWLDDNNFLQTGGASVAVGACRTPRYFHSDWYWVRNSSRAAEAQALFNKAK